MLPRRTLRGPAPHRDSATRSFLIAISALALILNALTMPAAATDNILTNGAKWHWSGAYTYYSVAAYTLPAGFQPAIDNAASTWNWPRTTVTYYKGSDVYSTDWANASTHIVWYGAFPGAWGCPSSFIACTFVQGDDVVNHHLSDADTVWGSQNSNFTNTCPWWLGAYPDIQTVFLHEFGHWGTLGHTSDSGAVMWGSYWNCRQTLTQHDIDSMNALYVH